MSGKAVLFALTMVLAVTTVVASRLAFQLKKQTDLLEKDKAILRSQLTASRNRAEELERQVDQSRRDLTEIRKRGDAIYRLVFRVSLSPVQQLDSTDSAGMTAPGSINLGAVATLVSNDGSSIRFTNPDLLATLESGRLQMVYEPENPAALNGRQISDLSGFGTLKFDYSAIFPLAKLSLANPANLTVGLSVNDLDVFDEPISLPQSDEEALRFAVDLSPQLSKIGSLYTEALRAQSALAK